MSDLYRSSNESIHDALRVLARDIQSEDGVANAAIAEAADRISELGVENDRLHLQNAALKREIEEIKRVRYCAEDALTRSQFEAAAAWADKERLDWLERRTVSRLQSVLDHVELHKLAIREAIDLSIEEIGQ